MGSYIYFISVSKDIASSRLSSQLCQGRVVYTSAGFVLSTLTCMLVNTSLTLSSRNDTKEPWLSPISSAFDGGRVAKVLWPNGEVEQPCLRLRANFWTMSKFFWTLFKGPLIQRCSSSAVYTPKNIFFQPFFVFSLLLPFSMLKNAFKKYPPQNRTNVQIKRGGVKGLLNNVQKNCTFLKGWLALH